VILTLLFIGIAWAGITALGVCIFASNLPARENERE
jgi:hypothetical protein